MGRTVPTFVTYLQRLEAEVQPFRRALRAEDREAFDRLFTRARTHAAAATNLAPDVPFDGFVLAVLLGQELELARLRARLDP